MKTIGIKLADGSFYPVLEDNTPSEKNLELTTAHNNQTKIMVDLYRSASCSMEDAEYVDSLQIENLVARPNGEPNISFTISIDEDNKLSAKIIDEETGNESNTTITLVSRTLEERLVTDEYDINDSKEESKPSAAGAALAGVAAGGLLATAMALRNKSEVTEDIAVDVPNEITEDITDETAVDIPEEAAEEPVNQNEADETVVQENSELPDMDFDIPDEEPAESADETLVQDNSELPDMDFDIPNEEPAESADETLVQDNSELPDMDFDIPDEEPDKSADETLVQDNSELPDMDFDIPDEEPAESPEENSSNNEFSDMDFDIPDNFSDDTTEEQPQMPDNFFDMEDTNTAMNTTDFDDSPAPAGLNFDGLYDEETERGVPAENSDEDVKKKTKTPVIICIICAIICIIATVLILFIIPSKYNLLTKKNTKDACENIAVEEAVAEPEPVPEVEPEPIPEAKEDEVIIIEKAEEVVPQQPAVAEEKPKNITYKIKWGDTLWDIADTYYKNPWRYKYIARYNGIRNPDYIISGTLITIPAE